MSPIILRTDDRGRRPNPLLALYRWRHELALVAVLAGLIYLGQATRWAVPLGVVLAIAVVVAGWPRARRAAGDRFKAVVVQHRLRTAFHELCLTTWAGRTPAILYTAPRRQGLRVHLLCPAGIAARDFTPRVRAALAAACDAPDVLVEPNPRHSALVVLVITRAPAAGGASGGPLTDFRGP
jgi:hypothetical protein